MGQPINFSPRSRWTTLLSWIKAKVLGRRLRSMSWVEWLYLVESWRLGHGHQSKIFKTNGGPIMDGSFRHLMGWPPSCGKLLLVMPSVLSKLLPFGWNLIIYVLISCILGPFLEMARLLNKWRGFHATRFHFVLTKQFNFAISYIKT